MNKAQNKVSILIVDDVVDNLTLLTDIFEGIGYVVRQVRSGEQALKSVTALRPSLVLLDIKMPGMDGYEVCRRMKDRDDLKGIPVIFISGINETFNKLEAFSVGGVDYITKPFVAEEVTARVAVHLEIQDRQIELEKMLYNASSNLQHNERPFNGPDQIDEAYLLTLRERECLLWLSRGLLYDRIGAILKISSRTVEFHLANARKKLGTRTREETLVKAIQLGLIELSPMQDTSQ